MGLPVGTPCDGFASLCNRAFRPSPAEFSPRGRGGEHLGGYLRRPDHSSFLGPALPGIKDDSPHSSLHFGPELCARGDAMAWSLFCMCMASNMSKLT